MFKPLILLAGLLLPMSGFSLHGGGIQGGRSLPPRLDLESLVAYAMENNPSVLLAKERIREQEGLIVEVKSTVLPNASLNGNYGVRDERLYEMPGSSQQNWMLALQVRQLLYSGGGVSAALDAQRYAREAALHELRAVVDQVLFLVRNRYYDVLLGRNKIEVQEQNVRLLEEQLVTARSRYEAQSVSRFDVIRAEVELANAQPPLIRARNDYRIALDELLRAIGHQRDPYAGQLPAVLGDLSFRIQQVDLQSVLSRALVSRPELQYLETMKKAREAGVTIARSGYLPTVSLVGGYELVKDSRADSFGDSLHGWTIGIQSSWSIFDGRATEGKVIQARSKMRQVELSLAEQRHTVELEVRRAVSSLQEATELTESAQKVVEQAEEALRLADARYQAGSATQLDVLQVRVALTQARTNQYEANYSYLMAEAALKRALGETQ